LGTRKLVFESCVLNILHVLAVKSLALCEHSVHVAFTATDLALLLRNNGLDSSLPDERDTFIAGLIHDLGKLSIEDNILTKRASLNYQERKAIRNHTVYGYNFASKSNAICHLADYVLQHHERPDGRGYPRGLNTENIMIMSRVLNIADRFAGMLVDRPYRDALPARKIVTLLEQDIFDFFDRRAISIVNTLLSIDRSLLEIETKNYLTMAGIVKIGTNIPSLNGQLTI
jgi:HD-GYP domain-containing protein (c-di-GMP phosphodiesterase class II)